MMGKAFYITIILQGVIIAKTLSISSTNIFFLNFYSKAHKIIIKLNNKSVIQILDS